MKKRITAAELMAQLNANPDYVARRAKLDAEFAERERVLSLAERPLVEAIAAAGVQVESVWDLVNCSVKLFDYSFLSPILLEHLAKPYPDAIRDGIARALALKSSKVYWRQLLEHYRREPDGTRTKDGLAVALSVAADRDRLGEVISLVEDRSLGESRIFFVGVLSKSRQPEARAAFERCLDDPQLVREATRLLKRKKKPKNGE